MFMIWSSYPETPQHGQDASVQHTHDGQWKWWVSPKRNRLEGTPPLEGQNIHLNSLCFRYSLHLFGCMPGRRQRAHHKLSQMLTSMSVSLVRESCLCTGVHVRLNILSNQTNSDACQAQKCLKAPADDERMLGSLFPKRDHGTHTYKLNHQSIDHAVSPREKTSIMHTFLLGGMDFYNWNHLSVCLSNKSICQNNKGEFRMHF